MPRSTVSIYAFFRFVKHFFKFSFENLRGQDTFARLGKPGRVSEQAAALPPANVRRCKKPAQADTPDACIKPARVRRRTDAGSAGRSVLPIRYTAECGKIYRIRRPAEHENIERRPARSRSLSPAAVRSGDFPASETLPARNGRPIRLRRAASETLPNCETGVSPFSGPPQKRAPTGTRGRWQAPAHRPVRRRYPPRSRRARGRRARKSAAFRRSRRA